MKRNHLPLSPFLSLLLIVLWILPAAAQSSKQAVIPFDSPDPTAIEDPSGTGFYVFSTGRGIPILHSKNLLDWERAGRVFSDGRAPGWAREMIPGGRGIWAPDIVRVGDVYMVYYSFSTFGGQRSVIGLATNKSLDPASPDYEWVDRGIVLESHPDHTDYNAIDSALFVDEDGKAYLYWGSYWTGLKAVEVDPKTGKPFKYKFGDMKIPADYIVVANRGRGGDTSIEAPHVIRRGKFYYLFTSRGSCCDGEKSTYHITLGRSEKPLGPFVDKEGKRMDRGGGTLLIESDEKWKGTGHNGFFRSEKPGKNKGDWLVLAAYDAENPKLGRLTQIRPLTWDENDWPVLGDVLDVPFEKFEFKK